MTLKRFVAPGAGDVARDGSSRCRLGAHRKEHDSAGIGCKPLPFESPEFDCSDCRIGPSAMFTLLQRLTERMRRSEAARAELHELRDYMMRYHFWDWGNTGKRASDVGADALQATA